VFPDAERLDIGRPNARRHLAFGFGVHRCVGARLAELQIQILFEEMLKRRMTVQVTGAPDYVAQSFVHGYRKLPVVIRKH
jgi:cytochrome P450